MKKVISSILIVIIALTISTLYAMAQNNEPQMSLKADESTLNN